jgi:hypothetical protein
MKLNVELDYIRSGQTRPYADSTTEVVITYSRADSKIGWTPPQEVVENHAKALVRNFKAKEGRDWHETYLESIEELAPGKWKLIIVEPYLD